MNNEEHDDPQVKSEEEEVSQSTSQELQNDVNVEDKFEDQKKKKYHNLHLKNYKTM